ncbi:MAG: MaoC family dehydratase [Chloroflexota bacterium]
MSTTAEALTADQILAMPTYNWDVAEIGDEAPLFTQVITQESIAKYCEAVRNWNPLYLAEAAAKAGPFGRIVAPPSYAIKAAPLRRNEVMHAKGYAAPEEKGEYQTPYAKCELRTYRPIFPGDTVTSRVFLEDKLERRGKRFAQWKVEAKDGSGQPLFDYTYTTVWPDGPGVGGKAQVPVSPDPLPEIDAKDALPIIVKHETQEAIDRYGELTRVRPRIGTNLHQDPEFARRTLFGGTANAGPASLAYCAEVLERGYGPEALLRPGARVEYKGIRPVRADDKITLRGKTTERGEASDQVEIWVHAQDGGLRGVGNGTVIVKA